MTRKFCEKGAKAAFSCECVTVWRRSQGVMAVTKIVWQLSIDDLRGIAHMLR